MIKETDDTVHYYSDTLIHKLEQAFNSDVTLILAPAGYGKTTAIRDLMKRMEQKENLKAEWITASSEINTLNGIRCWRGEMDGFLRLTFPAELLPPPRMRKRGLTGSPHGKG